MHCFLKFYSEIIYIRKRNDVFSCRSDASYIIGRVKQFYGLIYFDPNFFFLNRDEMMLKRESELERTNNCAGAYY